MDAKTYGGYTVAALREFIAHHFDGEHGGDSIDELTSDNSASVKIVRDLLDALPCDATQAPQRDVSQLADWLLTDPQSGAKLRFAGPLESDFLGLSRVRMENERGEAWTLTAGLREGYLTAAERMANIRAAAKEESVDTTPVAPAAAASSEDAYVAQRMSETLAEVWATIIGDDAQPEDESLNAIERVKKAAQVLRLEVDLYRAQRNEAPFQARVHPWMMECFGPMIAGDREERNHRFLEESLELVQACGCTASEAHQLVDYVFGRPVGEPHQEVGGVMVTLAALCLANGLDMHADGETELARISVPKTVAKIRAKQAAKPRHSPLPEAAHSTEQRMSDAARDAEHAARYRWLQARVFADRGRRGLAYFGLPLPKPVSNPMFGSVAQHFDEAIDAAREAEIERSGGEA